MFSSAGRCLAKVAARRVVCSSRAGFPSLATAAQPIAARGFASAASSKAVKTLQAEIKHEEEQFEQSKEIKAFLKKSDFQLVHEDGNVNVALERTVGDKVVKIEWQLSSPFAPEEDAEGENLEEATEFSVLIESKSNGAGIAFYCSTQTGEDHRYIIGNCKSFASAEERDSISAYNGPDFEDVDDKLQEALDEYLAEVGMNNEVCDFIDGMASEKEQLEYIRWLKITKTFLES